MNTQEAKAIIEILNAGWQQAPIAPATAALWVTRLLAHPYEATQNALMAMMDETKYRPHISEVLKAAKPEATQETAHEAYQAVLGNMWRPVADRAAHVSARALAAVMRLGGWGVVGAWDLDKGTWNFRDFREAYEDGADREADHQRRAIVSGESKAIGGSVLALAQAKRLKGGK